MNSPELHVIVDASFLRERTWREVVSAVLAGGADVVQLRDKAATPAAMASAVRSVRTYVRSASARLIVNDHWEVARDEGADGAHVGAADTPVLRVREACPRPFLLGASARTPEGALAAEADGADYLGVGPVFGTDSKADAPAAIGVVRVAELVAATRLPIIGIGGVNARNARAVILAGAAGVAVLSAAVAGNDPEAATRRVREALAG